MPWFKCFRWRKNKVHPLVPATATERTSDEPAKKKRDGPKRFSSWSFWRKNKVHPLVPATAAERTSDEPAKKKRDGPKRFSSWSFWRKKNRVHPAPAAETSETPNETGSLKLPGGVSPWQTSNSNKGTSPSPNAKVPERKKASVKPASNPPGTKRIEAHVRADLNSLMTVTTVREKQKSTRLQGHERTTAARKDVTSNRFDMKRTERQRVSVNPNPKRVTRVMEDRKKTPLHGQERKEDRKVVSSNRLHMKNVERKQVGANPSSKLPGTKRTEVKKAPVQTSAVMEEKVNPTLHVPERKEDGEEKTLYNLEKEIARLDRDLERLLISSHVEYKKDVTDPYAFSFTNMMHEENTESQILTPFERNTESRIFFAEELDNLLQADFELNMDSLIQTRTVSPLIDKQLPDGGLPNFGASCYVNASLQCLFRAETFCSEISHRLDNSINSSEDSFLRCFVELSKLRKGSDVQGAETDSYLRALIESASEVNPEFTIDNQNDAHEFLCHCLTLMEESGRCLGWQQDVHPRCPIRANFKFNMRNIITCGSCGSQQANKVEVFNHISVPLVHDSVDLCLYDVLNNPTVLESKCKACGGGTASSRWSLTTLPRFLILHLNRFELTKKYVVRKLKKPVYIKPELEINCVPESETGSSKSEDRQTDRKELGGSASTYRLISVLSHVGETAFCGHYVTDCSDQNPEQWISYDDSLVTLTTETKVLQKRLKSAYVLLYERVSTG